MDFIASLLKRLPTASAAELAALRADYETYLTGLAAAERTKVTEQVEPLLKAVIEQSINRMDAALATYAARHKGQVPV